MPKQPSEETMPTRADLTRKAALTSFYVHNRTACGPYEHPHDRITRAVLAAIDVAMNSTREEGDADDVPTADDAISAGGPNVAPPAVGPHNPAAGVPDAARKAANVAAAQVLAEAGFHNAIPVFPSPFWLVIQDVVDAAVAAALPHLERAAVKRFISSLTDAQLDAIDDLVTEWANTAPDGTQIHGFDMDRWREGFREGLRRVLYTEEVP